MRHFRRETLALFAVLVVATGCGGLSQHSLTSPVRDTSVTTPAATTPAASTSSTTTPTSAGVTTSPSVRQTGVTAAQARLARTVIQATDLPAGWANQALQPGDQKSIDQFDARVAACVGARNTDLDRIATRIASFIGPDQASGDSQATAYASQTDLSRGAALWRNPKTPGCFKKLGSQGYSPQDHLVYQVTMTGRQPGQPAQVFGNRTVHISTTDHGKRVSHYLNAVYLQGPLLDVEIDFAQPGKPVPAALRSQLVAAVAARAVRA